jgi:aryl carrier-like protein
VQPAGGPAPERVFVVSPRPVDPFPLPAPLAGAWVCVDPAAAELDLAGAWRAVQAAAGRPARPPGDEVWATPEEEALAKEVVEPVLGQPVRRDDDLFSLGATSLQLMRVLLQVKERSGVEVPLARFLAAPTVATLADLTSQPADPAAAALDLLDEIAGET